MIFIYRVEGTVSRLGEDPSFRLFIEWLSVYVLVNIVEISVNRVWPLLSLRVVVLPIHLTPYNYFSLWCVVILFPQWLYMLLYQLRVYLLEIPFSLGWYNNTPSSCPLWVNIKCLVLSPLLPPKSDPYLFSLGRPLDLYKIYKWVHPQSTHLPIFLVSTCGFSSRTMCVIWSKTELFLQFFLTRVVLLPYTVWRWHAETIITCH